jgi:hypothetical protein
MARALTAVCIAALAITATPTLADAANRGGIRDRIEDRIDRRESIRDERVDLGPRDVIEDRLDRRESRRDRAGLDAPRPIDRWERISWRRFWGNHEAD